MSFKINLKKNHLVIAYKLLNDVLFIGLVFFLLSLIAEGVLPGIISSHIGFPKIVAFVFVNIFAIYAVGSLAGVKLDSQKTNKKTAAFLLLIVILLVFNSLIKINILLNLFILILVLASGYFLYKTILLEEK